MEEVPGTGPILFSQMPAIFGSNAARGGQVLLSDYTRGGAMASNIDFTTEELASGRSVATLRGKGNMQVTTVGASNPTTNNATVHWSGKRFSFVRVDWGTGFSNIPAGITSFTVPGLAANQLSRVTVRPVTRWGQLGTTSNVASVVTLPTQVTVTAPTNILQTSATINWTGGNYMYIRVTWEGGSTGTSGDLPSTATSFNATGLVAGQSYTFRVTPLNQDKVAGTFGTTSLTTAPNTLSNIRTTSIGTTWVTIAWDSAPYTKVVVSWSGPTTGSGETLSPGTSFYASGLVGARNYTFTVTPYSGAAAGQGTPHAVKLPAGAITGLSAVAVGPHSVKFTITGGPFAYARLWHNSYPAQYQNIITVPGGSTSYIDDSNLYANQYYTYQIIAYNEDNVAAGTTINANQVYTPSTSYGVTGNFYSGGVTYHSGYLSDVDHTLSTYWESSNYFNYYGDGDGTYPVTFHSPSGDPWYYLSGAPILVQSASSLKINGFKMRVLGGSYDPRQIFCGYRHPTTNKLTYISQHYFSATSFGATLFLSFPQTYQNINEFWIMITGIHGYNTNRVRVADLKTLSV